MKNDKGFTRKLASLLIPIFLSTALIAVAQDSKKDNQQSSAYEKEHTAEVESYLAKAQNYFEMAEFTFAQIFYDKALRLDKDNPAIKAKVEECKEYRARQKELLQSAPEGEKRKEFMKSKYDAAVSLYKQERYPEAKKEFEEIWLLAVKGDYKKTKKYLRKIKEEMAEEKEEARETSEKKDENRAKQEAAEKAAQEKKVNALIEKGEDFLKINQYDKAMSNFENALDIDPDNKKAARLHKLAEVEKEAVKNNVRKVAQQKKKEAELEKQRAERRKAREAREKALEEARRKAREEQKKAEMKEKEEETRESAQAEKKEQAKQVTEDKAPEEEKQEEQEQERQEAEKIKKIQEEKLEKVRELTQDAENLMKKEKYDEAIEKAEEALKIDPLYADAAKIKTDALQKKEAAEEAEKKRLQAEKEAREKEEQIENLIDDGEDLFDQGDYDEAAAKFQEVLRLNPSHSEAREMLSEIAEAKKQEKQNKIDDYIDNAEELVDAGNLEQARSQYQAALALDMNNEDALDGLKKINRIQAEQMQRQKKKEEMQKIQESRKVFQDGLEAYENDDIETAVQKWNEALEIYPDNEKAATYLEETQSEYEEYLESEKEKKEFEQREAEAKEKMNTLISVSTTVPHTPLISYLDSLSLVSGINFYVTSGVEATVDAKFVDTPLHVVLDTLLPPIGLKWSRKPGTDIVTITPDLQTKIFNLSPEEISKVKAVMDRGELQKILWGKDGVPQMKGVELTLDEREGILISVDSRENVQKIAAFLEDLKDETPPELIFRTYRLREGEGPKVKSLLEAILKADSKAPYAPERKLLLDGRDLIVKDTPENIQKVEQLLQDKGFIEKIRSDKLVVENWILVPKDALQKNPEQLRQFGEWVVEVIKVMLYAKSTVSKAEAEGRRLWWDPATMQLTITDYPDNIRTVSDFIHSLPQLEQKSKYKIIPLRYAKPSDVAGQVNDFLGISGEGMTAGGGGESVTKSLSVGDDFQWRDVNIRLMSVNDNDVNDENDDTIELKIRTPGESRDVTMDEFDAEEVDEYEIVAEDVDPSSTPGEGRARLKVTYIGYEEGQVAATPTPEATPEETEEGEKPVQSIEAIDAIFVEYTDPAHLTQVEEWVQRLDVRTQQASIETKFVEVIESRAKEFSSQLSISDLTQGVSFDDSILNMRFANNIDELQNAINSQYEPVAESPYYSHLMKGTTVLSMITGGDSPINWQLRLLEAEGVVNVVNGPHIVVEDGESATFEITRHLGGIPEVDSSGNYVGNQGTQQLQMVNLDLSDVTISSTGYIHLSLDATIEDQDALQGGNVVQEDDETETTASNVQYTLARLEKTIETYAQIKDGGTIVIGGWTNERSGDYSSGIPVVHNIPFIGKLLFGRNLRQIDKTTLLIFLTGRIVD